MSGYYPASSFDRWLKRYKLSERAAARLLGCSGTSVRVWRKDGAPIYIGLAIERLTGQSETEAVYEIVGKTSVEQRLIKRLKRLDSTVVRQKAA